jgi:hypothetical protein
MTLTNTGRRDHPPDHGIGHPARGLVPVSVAVRAGPAPATAETGSCTHTDTIAARQSSTILPLVRIAATTGTVLSTSITDASPADNISTGRVLVELI